MIWPWTNGDVIPQQNADYTVSVDLTRRVVRIQIEGVLAQVVTLTLTPATAKKFQAAIAQALAALGEEKE